MAIGTKVWHRPTNQAKWTTTDTKPTETKLKTQEPTAQSHCETGTEPNCRSCRGLHFERKAVQTNAGPLTGQYTQHGGRERRGGKGAEGRLGGRRWQGTGKAAGDGGEKGGTPVGPKDRTDKGNSLTEDTPRDAVTNDLRLHLHNFAYKTFKINFVTPLMCFRLSSFVCYLFRFFQ